MSARPPSTPGLRAAGVPALRALGRLARVRPARQWPRKRREALPAGAHDLLQLRGRLRAAGLRRQGHAAGPQVRGQPAAPGLARPQLRQGPRHDQPDQRPGAHPLPAAARGRARRGRVAPRHAGTRCSTRSAGASARRSWRAGATRSCTTSGRPGHERTMDRVLKAWGIDGHNSHTNVCSASARLGYALWSGYDRPSPDHANARFILLLSVAPGGRPLLQPARAADHRGQAGRREAGGDGPAPVEHRLAGRLLAAHLPGQRGGGAAGHGAA